MLDLKKYLLPEDPYVIIRMNQDFPSYEHRSDVDIVCKPTQKMAKRIKERHGGKLREHFPEGHHHLDYHNDKGLDFKFDLIETFAQFKKVKISLKFVEALLSNFVFTKRGGHLWRIPTQNYETVVRYIEWLEYPKKQKHKKYFDQNRNRMVDIILKEYIQVL